MKIFNKIYSMGKTLPKPIKNTIRPLYSKIKGRGRIKIDKELLKDIVEFHNQINDFKITYEEGVMLCKLGKKLMADLWNIMKPKTEEEIQKYYEICLYGLFELVYAHANEGNRKFREKVVALSLYEVLDYGGGAGSLSMMLAERGINVTYVDVPSINMEFAKWAFKKRGYNIEVLDAYSDQEKIWQKTYDTILCIELIEHVYNPKYLLEKLASNLRKGGKLIITRLNCPGPTVDLPLHFKLSFNAENLLISHGLSKKEGAFEGDRDLWIKK